MDKFYAFVAAHPVIAMGLSSLWAAISVDLFTFLQWKSWDDARTFSISKAALRYLQGLLGGLLGNAVTAGAVSVTAVAIYWLW